MKKKLNNKEAKKVIEKLGRFSKKDGMELDGDILLVNGKPLYFIYGGEYIPTLRLILEQNFLKKITVDMGAVPFVVKGADVMRPGITKIDQGIQKGEIISVVDEKHGKPLAVGKALYSGEEMHKMGSGKVILNMHYVGDRIWAYV